MKQGLLFVGGSGPLPGSFEDSPGSVKVAADSGLELALGLGIEPDLVVGDMDSISDPSLLARFPPERVLRFPADKDETDTEIGLRILRERGCGEITIVGGGGGRLDHLLGIVSLFEREDPPRRWITNEADVRLIDGMAEFRGWEGAIVSLFPLGLRAARMRSEGLRWSLDGLEFKRGQGGISNLVIADRMAIAVGVGKLLLVRVSRGACP